MGKSRYGFTDVILPDDVEFEHGKWISFKDTKGNRYETEISLIGPEEGGFDEEVMNESE